MKTIAPTAVVQPLCEVGAVVVGVEIGSAIIRAGVFASDHSLLGKTKISTKLERGPEIVIERIAKCIRYAVDECDVELQQVARIGVAAPGQIADHSVVVTASELGWQNVPLRAQLAGHVGLPIAIGQLFNVAALGIQATELQNPAQRFAAIFAGPKIGAAVRIGSEWQDLTALAELNASREELRNQIVATLPHALFGQFRGRDFRKALKKSENTALRDYVCRIAELAGETAARLHQAFALETIVVGGALLDEMKDEIMGRAQASFECRIPLERRQTCLLRASELGDLAPITGAAWWTRQHCAAPESNLLSNA